jgi:hypothetical protein
MTIEQDVEAQLANLVRRYSPDLGDPTDVARAFLPFVLNLREAGYAMAVCLQGVLHPPRGGNFEDRARSALAAWEAEWASVQHSETAEEG